MNEKITLRGVTRRNFLVGLGIGASALAAGCSSSSRASIVGLEPRATRVADNRSRLGAPGRPAASAEYLSMYGPVYDGGYQIPAVDLSRVDPIYYRQEVLDPTGEAPGTVVVDTARKFAYVVMPGGRAMRYGVGIGKQGFAWSGRANVRWKRKWPTWTPPAEMIDRKPELAEYADGMEPGLSNPLGARALYIFQGGEDTLYRLHGTPEYWTIGTAASSGCIRFMNQDVIDLYERVAPGSPLVVSQARIA